MGLFDDRVPSTESVILINALAGDTGATMCTLQAFPQARLTARLAKPFPRQHSQIPASTSVMHRHNGPLYVLIRQMNQAADTCQITSTPWPAASRLTLP